MAKKIPRPVVVDFETDGIEDRPLYPPLPVGVSIKPFGKKATYYAWDHKTKNNCTRAVALAALKDAWANPDGILCQNGKFDVDVAETHMGLPMLPWNKIHDTMFLLYLDDPHQVELGLKPSAARLLNMPADEQDAVCSWLLEHQPVPDVRISKSRTSPVYFAKYMRWTPGDLVGTYANGDTLRTEKLFKLLYPRIVEAGMLDAYNRERELMPILLDMERRGVAVDMARLTKDVQIYTAAREAVEQWIIEVIKAPADINLDSGAQLIEAMIKAKKADPNLLPLTPTGKYQTNKAALLMGVTDPALLGVLKYRAQLKTSLGTFMGPWLAMAKLSKGFIYTSWNQTKSAESGESVGTRTGRLSATWFMNMPKEFSPVFRHEDPTNKTLPTLPAALKWLPSLPLVRKYITPFKGHVLVDRDYSQQEPRILGHFDGGQLCAAYVANPWMDVHDYAKAELEKVGKFYDRRPVKNTNLGLIYGMGAATLAERNGMAVEEASELKAAVLQLYPGLRSMYADMKLRAKSNLPIRTWGRRVYYCEPPKLIQGRLRTFDYKMVNILIQGSAADCSKEAVIRLHKAIKAAGKQGAWFLVLQVHDQLTMSVPVKDLHIAMETLKTAMESVEFDVPMLSEGSYSQTDWASLKDYDKRGQRVKE